MIKLVIPEKLKRKDFRFIKVAPRAKNPVEKNWPEKNYQFDDKELNDWISQGGNVGIVGGYGNLVILDFDDKDYLDEKRKILPPTFTVRTGRGGEHWYYFTDIPKAWKISKKDKNEDTDAKTLVDIQGNAKQVLTPPSLHPNGNPYTVCKNIDIVNIRLESLQFVFSDCINPKDRSKRDFQPDDTTNKIETSITINELMQEYGYDVSRNPTMCKLGHDSKGGHCFSWNNNTNEWYCFHCDKGGGTFKFIMEHDNITFTESKKKLAKKIGIEIKTKQKIIKTISSKNGDITFVTDDYFDEKTTKFVPDRFAIDLLSKLHFASISGSNEILYYKEGIYCRNGEEYIKDLVRLVFGSSVTTLDLKEILDHVRARTRIDENEFDRQIELVILQNGVYNIENGSFMEHNPKHYARKKISINYKPEQQCPLFNKFISEILNPDDIPVVQEMFGYCLYKSHKFHTAFMLYAAGQNGKSTLLNLLTTFLGDENTASIPLQHLVENNFARAQLKGKLANIFTDLPKRKIEDSAIFKAITGNDKIEAEKKGIQEWIKLHNYSKQIFSANELPKIEETNYAFWRRWIIIQFPHTFDAKTQDTNLPEKLSTPGELGGILNWSINGLKRLLENNAFTKSKSAEEISNLWIRETDPVMAFIKDRLEPDSTFLIDINKEIIYGEYRDYCNLNGYEIGSEQVFFKFLKRKVPWRYNEHRRNSYKAFFRGLKIKEYNIIGSNDSRVLQLHSPMEIYSVRTRTHARIGQRVSTTLEPCEPLTDLETDLDEYILNFLKIIKKELGTIELENIYAFIIIENKLNKTQIDLWLEKALKEGTIYERKAGVYELL